MIEYQTGVPIPDQNGRGGTPKYPLRDMPVGASFFVPGGTHAKLNGAFAPHRRAGKAFLTRTVTENGVKGIRVWRTK